MKRKNSNCSPCTIHPVYGDPKDIPAQEPLIMPLPENGDPVLCGFVWRHGDQDYSAWTVELSEEDEEAINIILEKYQTEGFSVRNCYQEKFSDVFA